MSFIKSFLVSLLLCSSIYAQSDGWVFINYLGMSESLNSSLFLNVDGDTNIRLRSARWVGKSFTDSLYYAVKIEKWKGNKGRGLEWVHHKIYLKSDSDDIDDFSISDGYNLLFFNRVRPFKRWGDDAYMRLGLGFVFAHMDVRLPGRERFYMDGGIRGSYFSGVACQIALDKWVKTFSSHFVTLETKFTASYARPPISTDTEEYAIVPNYAFHVILGVGNKPATARTLKETVKIFSVPTIYMRGAGFLINKLQDQ